MPGPRSRPEGRRVRGQGRGDAGSEAKGTLGPRPRRKSKAEAEGVSKAEAGAPAVIFAVNSNDVGSATSQPNDGGATTAKRKRREAAAVLGNRGGWSGDQRRRRKKRGRAGEVNAQDPAMAVVLAVMAVEGDGGEAAGDVEEKGRWRRSAAILVEETGSTEARKAGGRRREQRLSRVASGEIAEEVEYEAGSELRQRRNRERRRWQRGRRNRVMGDDFPNSGDGKAERKKPWKRENVAATAREGRKEEVRSRGWRWIPTGGNAAAGDHTARWGRRDRGGRRRRAAVQRSWTATAAWSLAFKAQAKIVSIRPNKE